MTDNIPEGATHISIGSARYYMRNGNGDGRSAWVHEDGKWQLSMITNRELDDGQWFSPLLTAKPDDIKDATHYEPANGQHWLFSGRFGYKWSHAEKEWKPVDESACPRAANLECIARQEGDTTYPAPSLPLARVGDTQHHPAAPVAVEFMKAVEDSAHPYHALAHAFLTGYEQAAIGKGAERHANGQPFDKQHMQTIADGQGHCGGMVYQISKKAQEAERMAPDARKREMAGVMVYAAGVCVWTDRHNGGVQ